MEITINEARILEAIMAEDVSSNAKEAGAQLVEDWIRTNFTVDTAVRTRAVEMGFVTWVDSATLVVGVMDRVAEDSEGLFGSEWKSAKDGTSRFWNEEVWLHEIVNGPQLATYALALHEGAFLERDPKGDKPIVHQWFVDDPRMLVRAAVKTRPTKFWPSDPADAMYRFPNSKLKFVKAGYVNAGAEIRALTKTTKLPWQLTGKQCIAFGRQCELFESCQSHSHPTGIASTVFDPSDPAAELALKHVDADRLTDPDLVVLSASAYQTAARCKELYRVQAGSLGTKESNLALETGSAMHAGLADYFRQIKEQQRV
jgi:hypothetical protein